MSMGLWIYYIIKTCIYKFQQIRVISYQLKGY